MSTNQLGSAVTLIIVNDEPVMKFAAEELQRYLGLMSPERSFVVQQAARNDDHCPRIQLGLFDNYGLVIDGMETPDLDDAVWIEVAAGGGRIAGSNARSVLLAVYRFLEEAGCKWIRPGSDGEYIPIRPIGDITVEVKDKAVYRHRGICIEGAVSFENMLENIEWAPKAGFNSYFLEFKTPFTFFDRWYSHRHNPYKVPEQVTIEQVDAFTVELEKAIKKRGLNYHAVGHGWTGEPLGLPCLGWDAVDDEVDEETAKLLAQVNGKRGLWHGVPLNTNLCYSNPEARRKIVQYAADHAKKNKHIDMLHFWLADAFNNHCECETCRHTSPTDFYVMMLNELDEALSARALTTKIVFLLYLDLLWVPQTEKLAHPERFLLLFAPISRTYSRTYDADTSGIELPPYVRNQLKFPAGIRENVAFLKAWQERFDGDSFAYEYHFMWDHYYDPGYVEIAKMISADMKNLKLLGLNGVISDQTQRSFFPTGLGMHVMGKTLWNDKLDFQTIADDYFAAAFGEDADRCMVYLTKLSELFDPPYMRGEKPRLSREAAEKLRQVQHVVEAFRPVIERRCNESTDLCRRKSWQYMGYHADIVSGLAAAFAARAEGKMEEARKQWESCMDYVQRNEDLYQPAFDVFLFIQTLQKEFRDKISSNFGGEVI